MAISPAFSADAGHRQMCRGRFHDAQADHHLRRQARRGGPSHFYRKHRIDDIVVVDPRNVL